MEWRNQMCHLRTCFPGIPQNRYIKNVPWNKVRTKFYVSVYGREVEVETNLTVRENLEGAELDRQFTLVSG